MSEYNIQMNKYNALNAGYDQLYPATKIANVDGLSTALQNNDPRNWGLDLSKSLTDANDGTRNGFYAVTVGAANVPFDYGVLLVHNLGNPNFVHQELTEFFGGIKACRGGAWDDSTSAVKWQPWEWVNPPMQLGVEYRTTERYLGKPVYAMAVDCGATPNATTKDVIIKSSGVEELVFASFKLSSSQMLPYKFNGHEVIFNTAVYSDGELMVFITSNDDQSMKTVTGIVKYTKTTD